MGNLRLFYPIKPSKTLNKVLEPEVLKKSIFTSDKVNFIFLILWIELCKTVAISKQLGNIRSIEHKVGPVNTDKRLII